MNNLDKIKLTISARDSHGQYGMYREVEDREKYLSIKITERAKNLLNTSDINACALDCRILKLHLVHQQMQKIQQLEKKYQSVL